MKFAFKNPWKIEDIQIHMDNQIEFLRKFVIYDDSKLIQSTILKIIETKDLISEIKKS